jgi:hypothetical protein
MALGEIEMTLYTLPKTFYDLTKDKTLDQLIDEINRSFER